MNLKMFRAHPRERGEDAVRHVCANTPAGLIPASAGRTTSVTE